MEMKDTKYWYFENTANMTYAYWLESRRAGNYEYALRHPLDMIGSVKLLAAELGMFYVQRARYDIYASNSDICIVGFGGEIAIIYHEEQAAKIATALGNLPPDSPSSKVEWYYLNSEDKRLKSESIPLSGFGGTQEFYPWLNQSLPDFGRKFADSSANILLLLGSPGTGKTSFIRSLIRNMDTETWMTYDKEVQTSDMFYTKFQSGPKPRLAVIEDADVLLSKREDGNDLMGKILNVADGVASSSNKKMVFSTNLPGLKNVDDALTRPGRCFAVCNFRKLSHQEAQTACIAVGKYLKGSKSSYTLSEALNGNLEHEMEVMKLGF